MINYIDELIGSGKITEDVIMQTGYSDYIPKNAKYSKFFDYDKIQELYKNARIIITHGGPSSFIPALQIGKTPIVVPRRKEYGEHVNNHQVEFCEEVRRDLNILFCAKILRIF